MKAALIPPKGYEATAYRYSDIHLGLPIKACTDNPDYVEYLCEARRKNHYIIMDNGCAEGQLVDPEVMMSLAQFVDANEVVAPDIMSDMQGTLRLTSEFMRQYPKPNRKVMGVLQGKNIDEIGQLLEAYKAMNIQVVGIPKVLVREKGDRIRSGIARIIRRDYGNRFEIHLLGLSSKFPTEINDVEFPRTVRSMDSAQPYKVTEDDVLLQGGTGHHGRREDYFSTYKPTNPTLLHVNVLTFIRWAGKHDKS